MKIAEYFSIDHSTVIHGRDRVKDLISIGDRIGDEIEVILSIMREKKKMLFTALNVNNSL